jgi:antitoxin CptB
LRVAQWVREARVAHGEIELLFQLSSAPVSHEGELRWLLRRGMKELDVLFERYHAHRYPVAPPAERAVFVQLLRETEDPDLWAWVMGDAPVPPHFAQVLDELRRHR